MSRIMGVCVCASSDVVVPFELALLHTTLAFLRAGLGRRSAPCEASLPDGCLWPTPRSHGSAYQALPFDGCSWLMPHSQWVSVQVVPGVVVIIDGGSVLCLSWPCLWCGSLPPFWFNFGEHGWPSTSSCPTTWVFAGGCHARWVWSTRFVGRPCSY